MSLLACALALTASLPANDPSDSFTTPALAEFLSPAAPPAATALEGDKDSVLSYTYVELGVAQNDVDAFDEDVDIVYGRASLNLLGFFYVFAGYANQSTDFEDTDSDQYSLGVGAHFGVLPNLDLLAEISGLYNDVSSDSDEFDGSEFGSRVAAGARYLAIPWFSGGLELNGTLGHLNLDNQLGTDDDPFFWGLGVRAHFAKFLSVGVNYEQLEDDSVFLGSVRFSF